MKNMRLRYGSLATVCLLLLALLPASCIQDDYATKEKATVTMTFTTRAISNPTADAGGLEVNEHMRTLRVIVARKTGEILYNLKYDIAEEETSKTITFSEMTVNADGEAFDFYAIANEDGVGYTDKSWDNVSIEDLKSMELPATFLTAANASADIMIPQTAYKEITVNPQSDGGIQSETMTLDFAVAKVRLTIENTSTAKQPVSGISLSGVDMTSTPLFAGSLSKVNDGSVSLGEMTIPYETNGTPGKSTVYAYFYENTGGEYKLNATWETSTTFDIKTLGNLSEIKRGTELDITITIKKSVTTPDDFFIQVNTWDSADMEIPSFE